MRFTNPPGSPSPQGKVLTSTAVCPAGSNTPFAYGGGAQVTPDDKNGSDIVSLMNSLPGSYNSGSVTPAADRSSANAWEADAVVSSLAPGDTVTVQAYVICGP